MSSLHIAPISSQQLLVGLQASGTRWLELSRDFAELTRQAEHTAQQARIAETTVSPSSAVSGINLSEKRRQVPFLQRRRQRQSASNEHQFDISG